MSDINITTRGGRLAYRPGEWLEGSANWNLSMPLQAVEIRLLWFTRGRGTPDASVVDSSRVEAPSPMSDAPFRFQLPTAPHSFSGQLIALSWAVEVVAIAQRGKDRLSERLEFRLSPFDADITLPVVEKQLTEFEKKAKRRAEAMVNSMTSGRVKLKP